MCQNEFMAQDSEKKTESISFRFRPETVKRLKDLGEHHSRTLTNMVEVLIENAYKELQPRTERMPVMPTRKKK